jgi:hypothetical protein
MYLFGNLPAPGQKIIPLPPNNLTEIKLYTGMQIPP